MFRNRTEFNRMRQQMKFQQTKTVTSSIKKFVKWGWPTIFKNLDQGNVNPHMIQRPPASGILSDNSLHSYSSMQILHQYGGKELSTSSPLIGCVWTDGFFMVANYLPKFNLVTSGQLTLDIHTDDSVTCVHLSTKGIITMGTRRGKVAVWNLATLTKISSNPILYLRKSKPSQNSFNRF
jgi:hypothetical protein